MSSSPRKAYSYIRFSTPEQERGDSFRRQTDLAAAWATKNGVELDNSSYRDLGVSAFQGDNAETGMLGEFREAVRTGVVERGSYLLIEGLDRLSRDKPRKAVRLLEDICESGITVVTLADDKRYSEDSLDADPMAFMWAFMVAIRANEESATKSRRVREAWRKKKDAASTEKRPMTKRLPAWLALSEDRKTITVDAEKASVVQRIFREALRGEGQHRIAQRLTSECVPTFGDGKRRATVWHRTYVKKLLTNPAVIGTMIPHDTRKVSGRRVRDPLEPIPGYYPAIIKPAVFNRLNGSRAVTKAPRIRATSGEVSNVLASLAKCPACGATMTRINKGRSNGTPYLVCVTARAGGGCAYRQVRIDAVERAVRAGGGRLVADMPSQSPADDARLASLEAGRDALREQAEALLDEIAAGNASPLLRSRLTDVEGTLVALEADIRGALSAVGRATPASLERRATRLLDVLDSVEATTTECNAVLRDAFSRVVVDYRTAELEFHWHHAENAPTSILYAMPPLE